MSINVNAQIGGLTISGNVNTGGETSMSVRPGNGALAAGKAGTLGTRTDDNTGVVTLSANHGVTNGTMDVFWTDGARHGMAGTVATNDVTVDGGTGDVLPAANTAVVLCKQTSANVAINAALVTELAVSASRRCAIDVLDGNAASLLVGGAIDLDAGESHGWSSKSGFTSPLNTGTVASVVVTNGDSANTNDVRIGLTVDSVA